MGETVVEDLDGGMEGWREVVGLEEMRGGKWDMAWDEFHFYQVRWVGGCTPLAIG